MCARTGTTTSADERSNAVGITFRGEGFCKVVTRILRTSSAVAGAKDDITELLYFLTVRILPGSNCPVWQSGLTEEHRQRLEAIQRRAFRIISGSTDYDLQCVVYDIEPVSVRLQNLTRSFFDRINEKHDCLHWLLPPSRSNYTVRLRTCNKLPLIKCRTQSFKQSFLPYSLANFQSSTVLLVLKFILVFIIHSLYYILLQSSLFRLLYSINHMYVNCWRSSAESVTACC
jgi:hypothetical protein